MDNNCCETFIIAARKACLKCLKKIDNWNIAYVDIDGNNLLWDVCLGYHDPIYCGNEGEAVYTHYLKKYKIITFSQERINCLTFLMDTGIDFYQKNKAGKTILDISMTIEAKNILLELFFPMIKEPI
jgi:hypothetical protein